MERIIESPRPLQPWQEAPIGQLSPQMIQAVLSWTVSITDWLNTGGAARELRENMITYTRSEFMSKIEEFRTELFSQFKAFYDGKPFTEDYKKNLLARDFGKVQVLVSRISTESLEQASSFSEIKEELIRIENAYMKALSQLSVSHQRELACKFGLKADWVLRNSGKLTVYDLMRFEKQMLGITSTRQSWRSVEGLAEYLFKKVYAQAALRGLREFIELQSLDIRPY